MQRFIWQSERKRESNNKACAEFVSFTGKSKFGEPIKSKIIPSNFIAALRGASTYSPIAEKESIYG